VREILSKVREKPLLGQFDANPQLDIVQNRIKARLSPISKNTQLPNQRVKTLEAYSTDKKIGLYTIEKIEKVGSALDRAPLAAGGVANRLQSKNGIKWSDRGSWRSPRHTRRPVHVSHGKGMARGIFCHCATRRNIGHPIGSF
jgi:hypothetical protein